MINLTNKTTMKKIRYILILLLAFFYSHVGISQNSETDKIEQLKIAFFTEELDLTSSEAKRFWPVYTKHENKYDQLRSTKWESVKSRLNKIEELTVDESKALLKDYMDYKRARVEYREEFVQNLKDVISPKQIMMLKKAEYDFNKKLLKQYQSDNTSKD